MFSCEGCLHETYRLTAEVANDVKVKDLYKVVKRKPQRTGNTSRCNVTGGFAPFIQDLATSKLRALPRMGRGKASSILVLGRSLWLYWGISKTLRATRRKMNQPESSALCQGGARRGWRVSTPMRSSSLEVVCVRVCARVCVCACERGA